jgi:hypothetical protein
MYWFTLNLVIQNGSTTTRPTVWSAKIDTITMRYIRIYRIALVKPITSLHFNFQVCEQIHVRFHREQEINHKNTIRRHSLILHNTQRINCYCLTVTLILLGPQLTFWSALFFMYFHVLQKCGDVENCCVCRNSYQRNNLPTYMTQSSRCSKTYLDTIIKIFREIP